MNSVPQLHYYLPFKGLVTTGVSAYHPGSGGQRVSITTESAPGPVSGAATVAWDMGRCREESPVPGRRRGGRKSHTGLGAMGPRPWEESPCGADD